MRKFIVLPLLVLLAACTERTAVGPEGDPGFVAAKGGKKGPPTPEEPDADPAIAFGTYDGRKNGDGYCLRVMNDDGSNDTRLICGSGVLSPSWSPDGGSLAFVKRWYVSGEYELWRMDVTADDHGVPVGSDTTLLATCAGQPAWSPVPAPVAGVQVIAYPEHGYSSKCRNNVLNYVTTDGGTPVTLYTATVGVNVGFPAWSPDATKIAFVESRDPDGSHGWRIQIKDLSTLPITLVFDGAGELGEFWEIWDLDWSRGGDCLAFSAASAGNKRRSTRHVYTLRLSESDRNSCEPGLTQIIEGSGVAWSPDDGSLVVTSGGELVRVSLSDYSTETLRKGGFHPDWRRSQ